MKLQCGAFTRAIDWTIVNYFEDLMVYLLQRFVELLRLCGQLRYVVLKNGNSSEMGFVPIFRMQFPFTVEKKWESFNQWQ